MRMTPPWNVIGFFISLLHFSVGRLEVHVFGIFQDSKFDEKKWRPNLAVMHGVSTFFIKMCLVCRTNLIQNALCSYDQSANFINSKHARRRSRKFFRPFWSQKFLQKPTKFLHNSYVCPRDFLMKLQNELSPTIKYFQNVLWPYNYYHSIPLDIRNIKHTYNIHSKCIVRNVGAKNSAK